MSCMLQGKGGHDPSALQTNGGVMKRNILGFGIQLAAAAAFAALTCLPAAAVGGDPEGRADRAARDGRGCRRNGRHLPEFHAGQADR